MKKIRREEFRVYGSQLVDKVKQLINEGNVRRIIIQNKEGKSVIEIPVRINMVGNILVPALAAVTAVASRIREVKLVVEREANNKI
jgi:hypothetical protein